MVNQPWYKSIADTASSTGKHEAIVIGAGLAGCAITHTLDQLGWSIKLFDRAPTLASAASGNQRGIVKPHLTRSIGALNLFYQQAFNLTLAKIQNLLSNGHDIDHDFCGVLQLIDNLGLWPSFECAHPVDAAMASERANLTLGVPALYFPSAGWVDAMGFCRAMIDDCQKTAIGLGKNIIDVSSPEDTKNSQWSVTTRDSQSGEISAVHSDIVILATGSQLPESLQSKFDPHNDLAISVVAGQTTRCRYPEDMPRPKAIVSGKRFLIPDGTHCTVGSTYWRGNQSLTPQASDDANNIEALNCLNPQLPDKLAFVGHWRGLRATTPDRLPVVGALPDFQFYRDAYAKLHHGPTHQTWPPPKYNTGLYIIGGFGSRGIVSATSCAKLLAALIHRHPQRNPPLPVDEQENYLELLHPARFLIRKLKQGKDGLTSTNQ